MEIKMSKADLDFIGKKFNHLTAIEKGPSYISPKGHKASQWWCECDCAEHNKILVRKNNLTNGNTKSCGCQNKQSRIKNLQKAVQQCKLNLTNQEFGLLKAIKPTNDRKNGSVVWECKCKCGKLHFVAANELHAGKIQSCGCDKNSKGVRKIKNILDENHIEYIMEKTYPDCRFNDTGMLARFDFYIDNKFLLEYDGEQHFKETSNFFTDSLQKRQEHDTYKNKYCLEHNIPLKRIPYTELNNLSLDMIMGDKYLI